MLCEHCTDIFHLARLYLSQSVSRLQYGLYSDICRTAHRGCKLCRFIVYGTQASGHQVTKVYYSFSLVEDELEDPKHFSIKESQMRKMVSQSGRLISIEFYGSGSQNASEDKPLMAVKDQSQVNVPLLSTRLELVRDVENLICHQEPHPNTGSPTSLGLVKSWISCCIDTHKKYCLAPQAWKPERLIDIGSPGAEGNFPRLVARSNMIKGGAASHYLTLSHRWGLGRIFRLTTQNMESLTSRIEVSELSQTFQDAIILTRSLGLRYLWIDSLCILQDSKDDWRHESEQMGRIYQNAYCNILAMASQDGLFHDRNAELLSPVKVQWGTWGEQPSTYSKVDGNSKYYLTVRLPYKKSHLHHRGWILQEQMLAPRAVAFTDDQLFWECCEKEASETYPGGLPHLFRNQIARNIREELVDLPNMILKRAVTSRHKWFVLTLSDLKSDYENTRKFLCPRYLSNLQGWDMSLVMHPPDIFWYFWANLVEDFTRRNLTEPDDRVRALSGIISTLQARFPPSIPIHCHAGLWHRNFHDHLLRELLWQPYKMNVAGYPYPRRSPSWSWMSVDGPVIYFMYPRKLEGLAAIQNIYTKQGSPQTPDYITGYIDIIGYSITIDCCAFESDYSIRSKLQLSFKLAGHNGDTEFATIEILPDSIELLYREDRSINFLPLTAHTTMREKVRYESDNDYFTPEIIGKDPLLYVHGLVLCRDNRDKKGFWHRLGTAVVECSSLKPLKSQPLASFLIH